MELVINKINDEVQEIAHKTAKSVDDLAGNTIRLEKIISEDLVTRSKRILSPELNSSNLPE